MERRTSNDLIEPWDAFGCSVDDSGFPQLGSLTHRDSLGMEDPLKVAQMDFGADKSLASRRFSDGSSQLFSSRLSLSGDTAVSAETGTGTVVLNPVVAGSGKPPQDDSGLFTPSRLAPESGGVHEIVHSAPILSNAHPMSSHWDAAAANGTHDTMSLSAYAPTIGVGVLPPPGAGHVLHAQQQQHQQQQQQWAAAQQHFGNGASVALNPAAMGRTVKMEPDSATSLVKTETMHSHSSISAGLPPAIHEEDTMHPPVPMSAPIHAADGTFRNMWADGSHSTLGLKRKFSQTTAIGSSHGFVEPSPKRMKLITPTGTPLRDTHSPAMWGAATPLLSAAGPKSELPPSVHFSNAQSAQLMMAPTAFGFAPPAAVQMPFVQPHSASVGNTPYGAAAAGFVNPMMPGTAFMPGFAPGMWPTAMAGFGGGGMMGSMVGMPTAVDSMSSRRRRRRVGRNSSLVPKVERPAKPVGADKWKHMSKKERERARRSELKQCYEDLSNTLDLDAKRSGAQLPDRAEIVRGACEEIRRLERTLAGLQGAPETQSLKEHVKSSIE